MEEVKLPAVNEFIFAPFNTFMYLMDDRLLFGNVNQLKKDIIAHLNKEIICCEKNDKFKIQIAINWTNLDTRSKLSTVARSETDNGTS